MGYAGGTSWTDKQLDLGAEGGSGMDVSKRKPGEFEMSKHFTGQIEDVSSTLKIMVLNFHKDSELRKHSK
jgi:hypothetical protein